MNLTNLTTEAADPRFSGIDIVEIARLSRHLLARIVRHLVEEAGVRQFLD
ncbi:SAM-dependent methyltransferase, partial [Nonomuraea wenchangensis]